MFVNQTQVNRMTTATTAKPKTSAAYRRRLQTIETSIRRISCKRARRDAKAVLHGVGPQPTVDSLVIVELLLELETKVPFELPESLVQAGGYDSVDEVVQNLMPKSTLAAVERTSQGEDLMPDDKDNDNPKSSNDESVDRRKALGARLREARENIWDSLRMEVAKYLSIPRTALSHIESGPAPHRCAGTKEAWHNSTSVLLFNFTGESQSDAVYV